MRVEDSRETSIICEVQPGSTRPWDAAAGARLHSRACHGAGVPHRSGVALGRTIGVVRASDRIDVRMRVGRRDRGELHVCDEPDVVVRPAGVPERLATAGGRLGSAGGARGCGAASATDADDRSDERVADEDGGHEPPRGQVREPDHHEDPGEGTPRTPREVGQTLPPARSLGSPVRASIDRLHPPHAAERSGPSRRCAPERVDVVVGEWTFSTRSGSR